VRAEKGSFALSRIAREDLGAERGRAAGEAHRGCHFADGSGPLGVTRSEQARSECAGFSTAVIVKLID